MITYKRAEMMIRSFVHGTNTARRVEGYLSQAAGHDIFVHKEPGESGWTASCPATGAASSATLRHETPQ